MATKYRQDMPPEGGYREFNWNRTFPKKLFRPYITLPIILAGSAYGIVQIWVQRRQTQATKFEDVDIQCAMQPFLTAERDRRWLKVMRKNRELEAEVMKDVPGWKVGTWWGEPVFYTLDDKWWDPSQHEYFAHSGSLPYKRELMWRQHSEYSAPKWYDRFIPKWIYDRIY